MLFVSKELVQKLHLYILLFRIMNIFNMLRKVDIVLKTVVTNITFVRIIISKIIMFKGKMNFMDILVKFLLINIAIKQFILKVSDFSSLIFSDNISCFKMWLWQFFTKYWSMLTIDNRFNFNAYMEFFSDFFHHVCNTKSFKS